MSRFASVIFAQGYVYFDTNNISKEMSEKLEGTIVQGDVENGVIRIPLEEAIEKEIWPIINVFTGYPNTSKYLQ